MYGRLCTKCYKDEEFIGFTFRNSVVGYYQIHFYKKFSKILVQDKNTVNEKGAPQ